MAIAFKSTENFIPRTVERAGAIIATDGELLMRFAEQRDHRAFAEIVERHGRLVWMICQQVLRHQQDVEDAFQATFLILAKRARTIRASDSAAAWLFKVAHRTGLAARRKRTSRREESLAHDPPVGEEGPRMIDERELLYVLLQEIRTLPAQYQTPLLMRYLEGQSRRAIAEQTDSTVGQVHGRLVRGRRMLRARFLRGGVSLALAASAVPDMAALAEAAVTETLVASTSKTCLAFITSGAVGGLSPAALELAKEGVKAMWIAFLTKCVAVVSTVALIGGIGLAAHERGGDAGASSAETGIHLQVADAAETKQRKAVAADSKSDQPANESKTQQGQYAEQLKKQVAEAESDVSSRRKDKYRQTATLNVIQLRKADLQRQFEQMSKMLLALDSAIPGEESIDARDKRLAQRNLLAKSIDEVRDQLEDRIKRTAEQSEEVERLQLEVARYERRLDELTLLRLRSELAQLGTHAAQSTSIPNKIIGEQMVAEDFQRTVMQQVKQLEGGREALQAENAELKKELEMLKKAAPIAAWYSPEAKTSLLQWNDFQKNKQQAEQSAQSKAVPTGNAPLNAQQQIPDPLQVVPASVLNNSMHRIDELQRTLEKVQAENDELKKQLERRKTSTPTKKQDTSQRIIRPGDQVVVRLRSKQPRLQNTLAIYTVDKDGKILPDSKEGALPVEIGGMDGEHAADAIEKSLGHPNSWEEIRVDVADSLGK